MERKTQKPIPLKEAASSLLKELPKSHDNDKLQFYMRHRTEVLQTEAAKELMFKEGFPRKYVNAVWDGVDAQTRVIAQTFISDYYLKSLATRPPGLYVCGAVGVGKSSLVTLMMLHLVKIFSHSVRFVSLENLVTMMFQRDWDNVNKKMNAAVLVIDDVGRNYDVDFSVSKFNGFMEHRYSNELPTFFTSNLSPHDLRERNGYDRIADLLFDKNWCKVLTCGGTSMRGAV
jgi:DNA replication protein DnaC